MKSVFQQNRPSPNLGSAVDDLGAGQTQIAYLTPVAYINARKKYGVIPLVAPTVDGRSHFSLAIGVKAGSGINSPDELKGKRFAFGDEKALLQRAAVESMALNKRTPERAATLEAFDKGYDGFVVVDDAAYDSVRTLIQPFQK